MSTKVSGGCLCGAVVFELEKSFKRFFECGCEQCASLMSAGAAYGFAAEASRITWHRGLEYIANYKHKDKSLASTFCKQCGSSLPSLNEKKNILLIPYSAMKDEVSIGHESSMFASDLV
ncbi:GFA family protein [Agaribacterium sp. ZY112]|uniref:GFA family protein n=1 Tax=Agaribacterium sp. ZY112 TaxID=3233574 RepID=UPI0035255B8B